MSTELIKVSKRFGDFEALKSVDLAIENGEFTAILGPSGCGKTTLLRLLAGFDSPTSGKILMNGQPVATPAHKIPPEKRNVGMVFQSFALWPHMNVKEHVRFPIRNHKNVASDIKMQEEARIQEVLEMVGLEHLANRMPHELSGGQKQRVSFARAIAAKPSLLLMDEPLSSLDIELRMEMRKEIQDLHRATKASIVYVTHDQGEALAMADQIVVIKDGRIEQEGSPQEIFAHPKTEFVATFVGKSTLVKGKWEGDVFLPACSADGLYWKSNEIASVFQEKNLFPVRPEQFAIDSKGPGIQGTVINTQYQGKEIHYAVDVSGETWTVHGDLIQPNKVGDTVFLNLKQNSFQNPNNLINII